MCSNRKNKTEIILGQISSLSESALLQFSLQPISWGGGDDQIANPHIIRDQWQRSSSSIYTYSSFHGFPHD
jgi:hypothetical protein